MCGNDKKPRIPFSQLFFIFIFVSNDGKATFHDLGVNTKNYNVWYTQSEKY